MTFEGEGSGDVPLGATILEAADLLGVDLDHFCGGNCSCGTCIVDVRSGAEALSAMDDMERAVLGRHLAKGRRLACQTRISGAAVVAVPEFG